MLLAKTKLRFVKNNNNPDSIFMSLFLGKSINRKQIMRISCIGNRSSLISIAEKVFLFCWHGKSFKYGFISEWYPPRFEMLISLVKLHTGQLIHKSHKYVTKQKHTHTLLTHTHTHTHTHKHIYIYIYIYVCFDSIIKKDFIYIVLLRSFHSFW